MFIALTRAVSPTLAQCALTHLEREPIDIAVAQAQHAQYERCLAELGCTVLRAPAAPDLPDAVFIEDTAIVLDEVAIITRPGAASRQPETAAVAQTLAVYRPLHTLEPPGTLDGGDVLHLGRVLYVGVSSRSNAAGIAQLRAAVTPYGYNVIPVSFTGCLHLKSAVTRVGPETLLGNRAWVAPDVFTGMAWVDVAPAEPHAGNALLLGETVVYPQAYPQTRARLEAQGIPVKTVDVGELAKAEGGVTCCSLLFITTPGVAPSPFKRVREEMEEKR